MLMFRWVKMSVRIRDEKIVMLDNVLLERVDVLVIYLHSQPSCPPYLYKPRDNETSTGNGNNGALLFSLSVARSILD